MFQGVAVLLGLCCCLSWANVQVSVYYESMGKDSRKFLLNHFYPTYQLHADKMDVEFVPFGMTTVIQNMTTGLWDFICHYGENGCYGNKIQACAINLYPVKTHTEFIICAMNSANSSSDDNLKKCATDTNITWSSLQDCISTGKADDILVSNGKRTSSVTPEITYFPTIIYNDVYSEPLQNISRSNFQKALEFIGQEMECKGCHIPSVKASGGASQNTCSIIVLVLAYLCVLKINF